MYIAMMVVIGLSVGAGARLLFPRRSPRTIVSAALLGVTGSILGGFIGERLQWFQGAWEGTGFAVSAAGAVLFILLYPLVEDPFLSRDR